ncbi:MAG TPA: PH domain-containing protein [Propionibacteriaceae bacterium]|nr:PH domain-containing protein [Propionibacteriaceae bacterium]
MVNATDSSGVVVFRPRKLRVVGIAFTVGMCLVCAFGWLALPADVRALFTWSQRLTLLGCLGVIVLVLLAMAGSFVRADDHGVRLRNGLRTHQVEWKQVHKFLLRPGDPWAFVLLRPVDGSPFEADLDAEKLQLMGIQGSDGAFARGAVEELQRRQRVAQGR